MMRVSMLVFPVIRPGGAAACPSGPRGVVAVSAVATEAAVWLGLIKSAGGHLVGISRRVVYRLAVFVLVVESVRRLGVSVRVVVDLSVQRRAVVALNAEVVGAVLRVLVPIVTAALPGGLVLITATLIAVSLQRPEDWDALVWILFESEGLSGRTRRDEIRQPVGH